MEISSTVKTSVALAGIVGGEPWEPYARSGGRIILRLPPTRIPGTASFHPGMTGVQLPTVVWVLTRIAHRGSRPAWRLVSNCVPSLSQPVYWTVTVEFTGTTVPVPTVRSMIWSPSGNLMAFWGSPAWKSSPPTAGVGVFWTTPAPGGGLGVGSGYPQLPTTSAVSAAASTGKRVLESMVGALGYRAGSLARAASTTPRRQAAAAQAHIEIGRA